MEVATEIRVSAETFSEARATVRESDSALASALDQVFASARAMDSAAAVLLFQAAASFVGMDQLALTSQDRERVRAAAGSARAAVESLHAVVAEGLLRAVAAGMAGDTSHPS